MGSLTKEYTAYCTRRKPLSTGLTDTSSDPWSSWSAERVPSSIRRWNGPPRRDSVPGASHSTQALVVAKEHVDIPASRHRSPAGLRRLTRRCARTRSPACPQGVPPREARATRPRDHVSVSRQSPGQVQFRAEDLRVADVVDAKQRVDRLRVDGAVDLHVPCSRKRTRPPSGRARCRPAVP